MSIETGAVNRTHALPPQYYIDDQIFEKTKKNLFFKSWHHVCHTSQIPNPGDYLAFTLFDQDLFVIRSRNGEIRCFYNVCQHRGHHLVEDTGNARILVCPYHAWTYEQDGRLKAAPNSHTTPNFDKKSVCLTSLLVEDFLGFVFVNFDLDARSMDDTFPGVRQDALAFCPDIEQRQFAYSHEAPEYCNWLIAVENYNECYHCGHVHKSFSSGIIDPGSYDIRPFENGPVLRHTALAATGDGRWYDTTESDYRSFFLFPLFSLQIYPSGMINTYFWRPEDAENTTVHRGWYSNDGHVDANLQQVIDLDRATTFAEDLKLVKSVQRGMASNGYRPGPLVIAPEFGIKSEHSIAALHSWFLQSLEGAY